MEKTEATALANTMGRKHSLDTSEVKLQRTLYFPLLIVTLFVNKYVLSVLKFTYPTIFQGWQSAAAVLCLSSLSVTGHLSSRPTKAPTSQDRPIKALKYWIPAMFLHVVSIYSGSVALSRLPVPLFLAFHNAISVMAALVDLRHSPKHISSRQVCWMVLIVTTLVLGVSIFPGHLRKSIVWIMLHILSSGCYLFYEKEVESYLTISYMDRMYYNNVFGAVVLAPFSYLLGDLLGAKQFPYLYFYRFYVGCFASGLFGSLTAVLAVRLKEHNDFPGCVSSVAKVVATVLSLFIFSWTWTALSMLWIMINLVANILLKYESAKTEKECVIENMKSEAIVL